MFGQVGDLVFDFIYDIISKLCVGLFFFGFILVVYFSFNGMLVMMWSFEKFYSDIFWQCIGLKKRVVVIGLIFFVSILVILFVIFIVLGSMFIGWISELVYFIVFGEFVVSMLCWIVIFMVFYFGIVVLYCYGFVIYCWFLFFLLGIMLVIIFCIFLLIVFFFYIDEFNCYDIYYKFYGLIGIFIIIMLWIQINLLIFLIGFELNVVIVVNWDLKVVVVDD